MPAASPVFGPVDQPNALGACNVCWIKAAIERREMKPMEALRFRDPTMWQAYKKHDPRIALGGSMLLSWYLAKNPWQPGNYDSIVDV